ncbi:MAG: M24 family metallopeptidase [Acidobacteria bacterium]|nr:MAG: M24 family metallopeptidase [Acidobacteriota bacterium]
MQPNRRQFLKTSALGAAAMPLALSGCGHRSAAAAETAGAPPLPAALLALEPVAPKVVPITEGERRQRLARAQELMGVHKIDALFMEGGSSLIYFTGMHWFTSERTMGMLLPRSGDPVYITPAFEKNRALEQIRFGHDVRTWQENESPYELIAHALADLRVATGTLGIEEKTPYFMASGIAAAAGRAKIVSATPVTAGCRSVKSAAELALMQVANNATLSLYKAVWEGLRTHGPGMTQHQVSAWIDAGYRRLGLPGGASINVGQYTALPHGSREPQQILEGTPVMLDDGCQVEGYTSDITRTFVLGKASDKMKKVFAIVQQAQRAARAAARPGVPMESVDAAARKVITDAGYGPGYKYFSHRLGHGIGLDGHEWYYLVQGDRRPIAANMTFSDEPGIYIVGEFGVRLEDDMHITPEGAEWFTPQSPSIEEPFAS